MSSPFRVAVINDEVSQDFGHACEVISREFGLEWIELRAMWNKNILHLDAKEVGGIAPHSRKIQIAGDGYRQPAFQSGLARRAEIRIQS